MQLHDAIRKAREAKGMSQKEVALACKMDQAHYSRIENGKTDPSFSVVTRIAKAMKMEVYELLKADQVFKDINSLDKSIMEKLALIEGLDKKEKQAFYIVLDTFVGKKKLKEALGNVLNSVE